MADSQDYTQSILALTSQLEKLLTLHGHFPTDTSRIEQMRELIGMIQDDAEALSDHIDSIASAAGL